jgi:oleandomycin transport system ATP-binding protein
VTWQDWAREPGGTTANAVEATGLVQRFGKTTALDGVDLVARPGRVLGVLGPNRAGKPVTEL